MTKEDRAIWETPTFCTSSPIRHKPILFTTRCTCIEYFDNFHQRLAILQGFPEDIGPEGEAPGVNLQEEAGFFAFLVLLVPHSADLTGSKSGIQEAASDLQTSLLDHGLEMLDNLLPPVQKRFGISRSLS